MQKVFPWAFLRLLQWCTAGGGADPSPHWVRGRTSPHVSGVGRTTTPPPHCRAGSLDHHPTEGLDTVSTYLPPTPGAPGQPKILSMSTFYPFRVRRIRIWAIFARQREPPDSGPYTHQTRARNILIVPQLSLFTHCAPGNAPRRVNSTSTFAIYRCCHLSGVG